MHKQAVPSYIAPPCCLALLPVKVQLIASPLKIAPPSRLAVFPVKVQFTAVRL